MAYLTVHHYVYMRSYHVVFVQDLENDATKQVTIQHLEYTDEKSRVQVLFNTRWFIQAIQSVTGGQFVAKPDVSKVIE